MARTDTDADYWLAIADALGVDPHESVPEKPLYGDAEPIGGHETFPPGPSYRWPPAGEGEPPGLMYPSYMESTEGYIHDPVQTPMMQLLEAGVKPSVHPRIYPWDADEPESVAYPTTEREMLATMRMAEGGLRPVTREQILGKSPFHPHEAATAIGAPALLASALGRPRPVQMDKYGRRYRINQEWMKPGRTITKEQFDAIKSDMTREQRTRMSKELKKHGKASDTGPRDYLDVPPEFSASMRDHVRPFRGHAGPDDIRGVSREMEKGRDWGEMQNWTGRVSPSLSREEVLRRGTQVHEARPWGTGGRPAPASMLEDIGDVGLRRAFDPARYRTDLIGGANQPIVPRGRATRLGLAATDRPALEMERGGGMALAPEQALEVLRSLGFTLDMGE